MTKLHKIGTRVKIVRVDACFSYWKPGDTGVVIEHNVYVAGFGMVDLRVKMDRTVDGFTDSLGNNDQYVPITKPPLLDRIRRRFVRPRIDLTPGFSWEDMGWHPKDFIPENEKEHESGQ